MNSHAAVKEKAVIMNKDFSMQGAVLACRGLNKSYRQGPQDVRVLEAIDFAIQPGEHIAVVGASGSGKSTLLNVLGGLDKPDAGEVWVKDEPFSRLNENRRGRLRNQYLGFVYQFHHLLGEFTAQENVAMPMVIGGMPRPLAQKAAAELLEQVGLAQRLKHKPSELSGGERQRIAIARALANSPACVLMDEPTGNLDSDNAAAVQALMRSLSRDRDTSFLVVTHDHGFARSMDRVMKLHQGALAPTEA
jgi:lipoprotein-releasing system ATP-binding protein